MRLVWLLALAVFGSACSTQQWIVRSIKEAELELHAHGGFALYDPGRQKYLIEHQSDRYFTPASNTKIFTFYAALKILGDSAIALRYSQRGDSLIVWGAGDPSFLYPHSYSNTKTYSFLQNHSGKLFLSTTNYKTLPLGPGWAWDDYLYSYSTERTPLPIYGNLITIRKDSTEFSIQPRKFMEHFTVASEAHSSEEILRDVDGNQLTYFPGKSSGGEWSVPFRYSSDLVAELLSDTLHRPVEEIQWPLPGGANELTSVPLDSLYRVMMQDSDNFIAEQLLLQCAAVLSDTLNPDLAIEYVIKNYLADLPDRPQWVDGSGLSRYNLFTPRSIVALWEKIYHLVPQDRLFQLLAVGGRNGTIKNWYKNDTPYIYGKTGTLSNNHSLSGFLITRKGKIYIFSMMNNNYLATTTEVRKRMEKILFTIHEKF